MAFKDFQVTRVCEVLGRHEAFHGVFTSPNFLVVIDNTIMLRRLPSWYILHWQFVAMGMNELT